MPCITGPSRTQEHDVKRAFHLKSQSEDLGCHVHSIEKKEYIAAAAHSVKLMSLSHLAWLQKNECALSSVLCSALITQRLQVLSCVLSVCMTVWLASCPLYLALPAQQGLTAVLLAGAGAAAATATFGLLILQSPCMARQGPSEQVKHRQHGGACLARQLPNLRCCV